jgi:hypothetical protein
MPNLEGNSNNQRIFTTVPDMMKRKGVMPVRCHSNVVEKFTYKSRATLSKVAIKKIKLGLEKNMQSIKPKLPTDVEDDDDEEEEACTYELIEPNTMQPSVYKIVECSNQISDDDDMPAEPNEIMSEEITSHENPAPIIQCHQESQTDMIPESAPKIQVIEKLIESKDDKMIGILYPEYQHVTKINLIEMLNDRNQKIAVLEEKIQKLEAAMRNLL